MTYTEKVQQMFYDQRVGKVYGCFEVIQVEYDNDRKQQLWTLRCIHCGLVKTTYNGKDYVKGKNHGICKCQHTKCLYEKPQKIKKAHPASFRMKDHELYSRWKGIKRRCYDPHDKNYPNYGGRGITMCDEWREDFWAFADWAWETEYSPELTIDRIDNDLGYSPDNCRWATREEQNKHKRNVRLYEGKTLPDWCEDKNVDYEVISSLLKDGMFLESAYQRALEIMHEREFNENCRDLGFSPDTIRKRMSKGLTFQQAIETTKHIGKHFYEINGVSKTLNEWCEAYGITAPAVLYRMNKKGMPFEAALTTPKNQGKKLKNLPKPIDKLP